ncbi:hypothetical protein H6P81_002119 [Aristolochia fimbriata]|uniref:RBR-type E3 ubiquitin transferase n=1 Tax=Aristolochia fimbriata TaxID=158543 RepID=A0AAV7FA27_ARIFI|nr:hypothetical protein H6P81_002119 [Aristolochia fimbriata]
MSRFLTRRIKQTLSHLNCFRSPRPNSISPLCPAENFIDSGSDVVVFSICAESVSAHQTIATETCSHAFCSDCVGKYIASHIEQNSVPVKCPEVSCTSLFEPDSFHGSVVVPPPLYELWGNLLCEAAVRASRKLYCPFRDCSALLLVEGCERGSNRALRRTRCPQCHRDFCAECKAPWHEGESCSEHRNGIGNDDDRKLVSYFSRGESEVSQVSYFRREENGC